MTLLKYLDLPRPEPLAIHPWPSSSPGWKASSSLKKSMLVQGFIFVKYTNDSPPFITLHFQEKIFYSYSCLNLYKKMIHSNRRFGQNNIRTLHQCISTTSICVRHVCALFYHGNYKRVVHK